MSTIADNIAQINTRIEAAKKTAGRLSGIVQLIAVSKTRSANEVRKAFEAGLRNFGENYLQEALDKQAQLQDLAITWHFIGPIQSNKAAAIAQHFDWVHSIDRLKIAQRMNDQRPGHLTPLNICLQVNISNESTKSGVGLDELTDLAETVAALPHLKLRGLMAIPSPRQNETQLRADFRKLHSTLVDLNAQGFLLDTLSMGMSNDLECAIMEGATMVRIGTAIFGKRN
jgi:hypothetical protein